MVRTAATEANENRIVIEGHIGTALSTVADESKEKRIRLRKSAIATHTAMLSEAQVSDAVDKIHTSKQITPQN